MRPQEGLWNEKREGRPPARRGTRTGERLPVEPGPPRRSPRSATLAQSLRARGNVSSAQAWRDQRGVHCTVC